MTKIKFDQTLRFDADGEYRINYLNKFIHLNSTYFGTELLTIQVRDDKTPLGQGIIYSHPDSHPEAKKYYKTFEHPFVIFDYLQDTNQGYLVHNAEITQRMKKVLIQIYFFYSPKDIESSINKKVKFKDGKDLNIHDLYLNCFSKTRRIRTQIKKGKNISNYISTKYVVNLNGENHLSYLEFIDTSGLSNVGLSDTSEIYLGKMDFKDNLSDEEKSDIVKAKLLGTKRFEDYALGDLIMTNIFDSSIVQENNLRRELNLPEIKDSEKKLTVGAMTARLLRDYIYKYLDFDVITLNSLSVICSPNNIQKWLAPFIKKEQLNRLPYTGMVDGGRCVRELSKHPYWKSESIDFTNLLRFTLKFLADIDIDGCYGNGLKNQKFAIGNPSIDTNTYTLREFLKKYKKYLVDGLWCARLFGKFKNTNFSQDLIISKTKDSVRSYEEKLSRTVASDNSEVSEYLNALTSNMCCLTKEIHGGLLNSDILEIIENHTSNQEKAYWLDNIQVTGFLGYLNINKVNSIEEMLENDDCYAKCNVDLRKSITNTSINNKWIEIPLDEYAEKLLNLRKKYPKKTPMNNFLKLVINATYGVICSQYFDTNDTGISNVVVANNITARARVLAWCMSKALRTAMSITDGGVFDLNKVIYSKVKKPTLTQFSNISDDILSKSSRNLIFEIKPLLGKEIDISDYADENKGHELSELIKNIDEKAWKHCANMFPELSIFKENQFSFELKNVYTDLTLHNKSDYILKNQLFTYNSKEKSITLEPFELWRQRGTKGDEGKLKSKELYKAIENNEAIMIEFKQDSLIGLNEYQKCFKKVNITENELLSDDEWDEIPLESYSTLGQKLLKHNILPGDVKEMKRYLFSHIPTCMKHTTLAEYEKSRDIAEEMRKTKNPQLGKDRMNDLGWL